MPNFRRIFNFIFHAAAFVSAMLLVATLVLWPVSYHRSFDASCTIADRTIYVGGESGRAFVEYVSSLPPHMPELPLVSITRSTASPRHRKPLELSDVEHAVGRS